MIDKNFVNGFEKVAGFKEGITAAKLVLKHGPKKAKKIVERLENQRSINAKRQVNKRMDRMLSGKSPSKYNN